MCWGLSRSPRMFPNASGQVRACVCAREMCICVCLCMLMCVYMYASVFVHVYMQYVYICMWEHEYVGTLFNAYFDVSRVLYISNFLHIKLSRCLIIKVHMCVVVWVLRLYIHIHARISVCAVFKSCRHAFCRVYMCFVALRTRA